MQPVQPPAASILETIGGTPMVALPRLAPSPDVRLYAKLEGANPTGSVKDRIALAMIRQATSSGALRPGQTILEPSSGNTGISLALIGLLRGHPVRIVLPDNTTPERERLLRLYGAEIVHSPGAEGSNGAIRLAERLAAGDPELYMPFQYGNDANPRAHEEGTGPEIVAQVPDIDAFVAGLGTGGTLTGVGRHLKRVRPGVRVIAAEPLPGESVQGLRSLEEGFVPPVLDASVLDDRYLVGNRDAVIGVRRLLAEEGILAGLSSGAAIAVALRVAGEMASGSIVVLLADGALEVPLGRPLDARPRRAGRRARWFAAVVAERLAVPRAVADELMAHARAEAPNEACGLLSGTLDSGEARRYHAARNAEASPYVYSVHPDDLVRIVIGIEDDGEDLVAIFHSHTHTPAVPSPTDRREARYPGVVYLLASLSDPEAGPDVALRAWRIEGGESQEIALRIG